MDCTFTDHLTEAQRQAEATAMMKEATTSLSKKTATPWRSFLRKMSLKVSCSPCHPT
jgi:hypothetical protein